MKLLVLTTYIVCEGLPFEVRNETQYRPILCPLIQASPFAIELRFKATGSFPTGASKNVCNFFIKVLLIKVMQMN